MRRTVVTILIGLGLLCPMARAAQPQGVSYDRDDFDRLSSSFVLRDWITYAREEHERLRSDQKYVHPRLVSVMLNSGSDLPPIVSFEPMSVWEAFATSIEAESTQLVPDPIQSCAAEARVSPDLFSMLTYDHTNRRISGLDIAADRYE